MGCKMKCKECSIYRVEWIANRWTVINGKTNRLPSMQKIYGPPLKEEGESLPKIHEMAKHAPGQ